jgi:basic membrane protein A and related proteins
MKTPLRFLIILGLILTLALVSCTGAEPTATPVPAEVPAEEAPAEEAPAEEAPADSGSIQMPTPQEGKFNVAFVYVGPIGDGGWTYAHNEGREYLEANGDNVHTAYLESVSEGADAERVIRQLARDGFDAIFTTSFGFMDATATVAEEFPDVYFVHVSGFQKNETNFMNLFGAMESMKYLAGMIAGAKVAEVGGNKIGYIAPFPIPEVIRHANATAMGMKETCPECEMEIRWIFTWFDPDLEQQAAQSLIDSGASVVITGADTSGPVQVAAQAGLYGIGYDSDTACNVAPDSCLTTPYWHWGPVYTELVTAMQDGSFVPSDYYFDVDSGGLALLGFMEGQTPSTAVTPDIIPAVQEKLAAMQAGEFTRFDLFTGPINDNQGNEVVPAGVSLTQSDLEGIDATLGEALGRPGCTVCMNWLAEGIIGEIPQN